MISQAVKALALAFLLATVVAYAQKVEVKAPQDPREKNRTISVTIVQRAKDKETTIIVAVDQR